MAKGNGNTRGFGARVSNVRAYMGEAAYASAQEMKAALAELKNYSDNNAIIKDNALATSSVNRLNKILKDKQAGGVSYDTEQFKFATMSPLLAEAFEDITGIEVLNLDMYTGQSSMFHHRTGTKVTAGKVASLQDIAKMPANIGKMDIYQQRDGIVFTDYKNKFVLKPNTVIRLSDNKTIVTNHVSSSTVKDPKDFTVKKGYRRIKITP